MGGTGTKVFDHGSPNGAGVSQEVYVRCYAFPRPPAREKGI